MQAERNDLRTPSVLEFPSSKPSFQEKGGALKTGLLRALLVEDSAADAALWTGALESAGFWVQADMCRTAEEFERMIRCSNYDVILADYNLTDWVGIETVGIVKRHGKDIPIIVVTGQLGDESAVDCIRWGAADYVLKDRLGRLPMVVRRAIDESTSRRQSQVLAAALLSVGEGVLIAETVPDGSHATIVSLNSAFSQITGYQHEDLVGKPLAHLQAPDADADFFGDFIVKLLYLDCITTEMVHSRKDGSRYDAEWRISPIRDDLGGIRHYVVILRDITDRKRRFTELMESNKELARRSEELKIEKSRAEAANQAKSDFLTSISHEIRTPMNVIMGMADLLSHARLPEGQARYVEVFQRAGESLLVLINQLLDLSKIESGKLELEQIAFDLKVVLTRTIALFENASREKGLSLSFKIEPNTPTRLIGDPHKLQQVLTNLMGNAIKFTDNGSVAVTVGVGELLPNWECCLNFEVSDTGIGIPQDKIPLIFENFIQAEPSTARRYGGTGMGLSISRALVERMKGKLIVESEVGVGSKFRFGVRFGFRSVSPATEPGPKPWRILLCEDCEDNAFVVRAYLADSDYLLEHVSDGREAFDRFQEARFDLVLMDMQMPVLDGHGATRAIREWERAQGREPTPILALTAHAQREEVERCKASGCDGFLSKPIRKATLLAALAKHLSPPDRSEDGTDLPPEVQKLAPGYLRRKASELARLRSAIEAADYVTIATLGHQWKASGAAYGFASFSQIGSELERAAMERDIDGIRDHARRLEEAVSKALVAGAHADPDELRRETFC